MSSRLPRVPDERLIKAQHYLADFSEKGLGYSFAVHGVIVLMFLMGSAYRFLFMSSADQRAAEKKALEMSLRQAIRVDVVDLPRMKISDMTQVDPTQDIAPPAPVQDTSEKSGQEEALAAANVMKDKTQTLAKKSVKSSRDRVKELQESLRVEARRKELNEKLSKELGAKGGGRAELAGNQLSEGYSITGDIATESEAYHGRLKSHLNRYWELPGWIQASQLKAKVWMKIAPDGRIIEKKFVKKSGNAEFDEQVARALESANPFPAPPDHLVRLYFEEGIIWGFPE